MSDDRQDSQDTNFGKFNINGEEMDFARFAQYASRQTFGVFRPKGHAKLMAYLGNVTKDIPSNYYDELTSDYRFLDAFDAACDTDKMSDILLLRSTVKMLVEEIQEAETKYRNVK